MTKTKLERQQEYKDELSKGLWELYKSRMLYDVILVVDGIDFPCNRNILAATSPYFRAMFTNDLQETTQKKIHIYGVTPRALEDILNFLYSGVIDVGEENAQEILMASNMFELLGLVEYCVDFMQSQLHKSNCIEMYHFSRFHHCEKLEKASLSFILEHFTDIAENEEFLKLDDSAMESILECDDIYVKSEDFIFKVIENWVNYEIETRKKVFPRLFHKVRLPLVSSEFLQARILQSELYKKIHFV